MSARLTVAVDVGGTFTDLAVFDRESGVVRHAKASTTPASPHDGVLEAVRRADIELADAGVFFHGTTLGLNLVLEGKGARTGLLTTRGFRDVLEIARMNTPMYRLVVDQPVPPIPRRLRREVDERVLADGTVMTPLDEDSVRRALDELVRGGVEAVAVCLLHAYAMPAHEERIAEIAAVEHPRLEVSLSHQLTREYREYERTLTTAVDAAIRPRVRGYLQTLESELATSGFGGSLLITRSDGGVMSVEDARQRSVRTITSGPASGVVGAVALGAAIGVSSLITADMGGTSFDASVVTDGVAPMATSAQVTDRLRLLMPVVDVATVGAGGGSVAWIDDGGALRVGPHSAGAEPGPACYGRGGERPTFTDAALVSGLLAPEGFLGGRMRLDVSAARTAIEREVAGRLGLSVDEAASGIVALAEASMAATIEEITIGRGLDPRDLALVAYGGGGPLVAGALAGALGIREVVVPVSPATFSAWGMLNLDVVEDFARTLVAPIDELDPARLSGVYDSLLDEAKSALDRHRIDPANRLLLPSVDLRYDGQEHTLDVAFHDLAGLRRSFDERHEAVYGYSLTDPVETVVIRLRAVGVLPHPAPPRLPEGTGRPDGAVAGRRAGIHRESGGELEWTVLDRTRLRAGDSFAGPALIEEATSTTLVGPSQHARVDELGNIRVSC